MARAGSGGALCQLYKHQRLLLRMRSIAGKKIHSYGGVSDNLLSVYSFMKKYKEKFTKFP